MSVCLASTLVMAVLVSISKAISHYQKSLGLQKQYLAKPFPRISQSSTCETAQSQSPRNPSNSSISPRAIPPPKEDEEEEEEKNRCVTIPFPCPRTADLHALARATYPICHPPLTHPHDSGTGTARSPQLKRSAAPSPLSHPHSILSISVSSPIITFSPYKF